MQIGNYLVGMEEDGDSREMIVTDVAGDWSISYGEGTMMFGILNTMTGDESTRKYLEALFTFQYVATNYPHDMVSIIERQTLPVINGFAALLDEQYSFEASLQQAPTEQEDAEALKEVAQMEEIKEQLQNLDSDGTVQ